MATANLKYQLATSAGYNAELSDAVFNRYTPNGLYGKSSYKDVVLTRPNVETDLELLHTNCLLTVNGFVHTTEYVGGKLFILNAAKSMLKSKQNHIGLLSFDDRSINLNKIKITDEMILNDQPKSLYNKTLINFNKEIGQFILVIAGYMFFIDYQSIYRTSPSSIAVRFDILSYIERLYQLNKYRDIFTDLGISVRPNTANLIDPDQAESDAIIKKLLTLENSFLVEVPVSSMAVKKIYLEHSTIPSTFRTTHKPDLPLFCNYGKMLEYNKRKLANDRYTVSTLDARYNNYLLSQHNNLSRVYTDQRLVGDTHRLAEGYFLNVTATI